MTRSLSLIFPLITQHARKLRLKSLQRPASTHENPRRRFTGGGGFCREEETDVWDLLEELNSSGPRLYIGFLCDRHL